MWYISLTMMQCNHSVALKSFFHQVVWNGAVKLALIGSGCSVATEPTADISHFYNITQVLFTVRNTLLASYVNNVASITIYCILVCSQISIQPKTINNFSLYMLTILPACFVVVGVLVMQAIKHVYCNYPLNNKLREAEQQHFVFICLIYETMIDNLLSAMIEYYILLSLGHNIKTCVG